MTPHTETVQVQVCDYKPEQHTRRVQVTTCKAVYEQVTETAPVVTCVRVPVAAAPCADYLSVGHGCGH